MLSCRSGLSFLLVPHQPTFALVHPVPRTVL